MNSCVSMKTYRSKIIGYILLQFVKAGLILLPPYCYLLFLQEVITNRRLELLIIVILMYILVFVTKAFVSVWIKYVYNQIFPRMRTEAKKTVMQRLIELDIKELKSYSAGELRERVHRDTEVAVLYFEKRIEVVISIISLVITTGILLYLNVILAVISFLTIPLSFYITKFIKAKSNKQYERRRKIMGEYNDFMIHNMFFWKEVKSNCQEKAQQKEFDLLWKDLGDAFLKSHIFWFLNRTFLAFKDEFLTKMGLYLLGGILVIEEMATVPTLLTFMEYYKDYVNGLLSVSDIVVKRGEQEEAVKRIHEIMSLPIQENAYGLEKFESVMLKDVTFSYDEEAPLVLDGINMSISRGEKVVLLGESGCGKSTIIKLLAGYEEVNQGEILWNGKPMDKIFKQDIYQKVGFIMQESNLFNLSIRENLLFGKADASEEELRDACNRANIMEFIDGLAKGFDTIIGENGIRLSGGQRQRLIIARLFLHNPEVIIFDEATSALDYQNESEILNLLMEQDISERTFIMVTHRGTSISRCDRVIQM